MAKIALYLLLIVNNFLPIAFPKNVDSMPKIDNCELDTIRALVGRPDGLHPMGKYAGRTGGEWYVDRNGVKWFLKPDGKNQELQTSAEVISSSIYRRLGYYAPETHIVYIKGTRFSASRDLGEGLKGSVSLDHIDTSNFRQLRIFASFLKDWDRLQVGPNNFELGQNRFALYDFGGTLGSRSKGNVKPGNSFSAAIGTFEQNLTAVRIYEDFDVSALPATHPWKSLNREDASLAVSKLRNLLKDKDIGQIVAMANYSNKTDADYISTALKLRRDELINHLLEQRFPLSGPSLELRIPELRLYPERTTDYPFVSEDDIQKISKLVSNIGDDSKSGVILFRGQSDLTEKVLAKKARVDGLDLTDASYLKALKDAEGVRLQRLSKAENELKLRDEKPNGWIDEKQRNEIISRINHLKSISAKDKVVLDHIKTVGGTYFVSATRSLGVASGNFQGAEGIRYIYILKTPASSIENISEVISRTKGSIQESEREVSVYLNATPHVIDVYDMKNHQFLYHN